MLLLISCCFILVIPLTTTTRSVRGTGLPEAYAHATPTHTFSLIQSIPSDVLRVKHNIRRCAVLSVAPQSSLSTEQRHMKLWGKLSDKTCNINLPSESLDGGGHRKIEQVVPDNGRCVLFGGRLRRLRERRKLAHRYQLLVVAVFWTHVVTEENPSEKLDFPFCGERFFQDLRSEVAFGFSRGFRERVRNCRIVRVSTVRRWPSGTNALRVQMEKSA